MPFDDPNFAARIRERDPEAIRDVVHAYLPHLVRAARAAGLAPEEADDVAQATCMTFIESAPRFEGRSHVRTWLFGIMYRKIQEARRSIRRSEEMDDIDSVVESRFSAKGGWIRPPGPVDMDLYRSEIRDRLRDCLDAVPDRQRSAFVLKEIEGLKTDEICNIMEVSVTNLGVLLHRARNHLRECLEGKGIEDSSAEV
jgi:RNA polymerase sigma-70 factor (ECF subfamily)